VGHVLVKPEIRAAWQHEFGDTDYAVVARFANGAGNSFTVTGPAVGRDSLLLGAGVAVLFNDRVSMYAYYDGELARTNYSSNNVTAGLRFTF
jgi:outer membrane autotransporter protein